MDESVTPLAGPRDWLAPPVLGYRVASCDSPLYAAGAPRPVLTQTVSRATILITG